MVQLPATAAIEYVAACWVIFVRGCFSPGGSYARGDFIPGVFCPEALLSGGLILVPPQVQCVYAPSRLSVPSIVAQRTNKKTNIQTKRQTLPSSSVGSRPPLPKFSGYVEVEAHYIFHPSTIWVRPLFTELGPKKPPKSRFCHEANEYMSPWRRHKNGRAITSGGFSVRMFWCWTLTFVLIQWPSVLHYTHCLMKH